MEWGSTGGQGKFFEFASQAGQGIFNAHTFQGAGSDEAVGGGFAEHELDIFRGVDRAAVTEGEDVRIDRFGRVDDVLGGLDGVIPTDHCAGHADAAADGGADVGDDGIRALFRHFDRFLGTADIDDAEKIHAAGESDHFKFLLHAHAGLFQHPAEVAIDDGVGGEIVDAGETHFFDLAEPVPHAAAGVGGVYAADDGNFLDDGEYFIFTDLHGDGIGIAIGHHAGGGAVAHHAEAAGVVDDDEVCTAFFDELGADAGASSCGDDGFAFGEGGVEPIDNFLPSVRVSDSGPRIGHEEVWWVMDW